MTTARPRAFREKLNSSHLSLFFSPGGAFFLSFHEGRPLPPSDVLLQGRGIASPRFDVLVTEKEELAKGMDEELDNNLDKCLMKSQFGNFRHRTRGKMLSRR